MTTFDCSLARYVLSNWRNVGAPWLLGGLSLNMAYRSLTAFLLTLLVVQLFCISIVMLELFTPQRQYNGINSKTGPGCTLFPVVGLSVWEKKRRQTSSHHLILKGSEEIRAGLVCAGSTRFETPAQYRLSLLRSGGVVNRVSPVNTLQNEIKVSNFIVRRHSIHWQEK
jgi:hypothetical protein